jgi:hypothetical protein
LEAIEAGATEVLLDLSEIESIGSPVHDLIAATSITLADRGGVLLAWSRKYSLGEPTYVVAELRDRAIAELLPSPQTSPPHGVIRCWNDAGPTGISADLLALPWKGDVAHLRRTGFPQNNGFPVDRRTERRFELTPFPGCEGSPQVAPLVPPPFRAVFDPVERIGRRFPFRHGGSSFRRTLTRA